MNKIKNNKMVIVLIIVGVVFIGIALARFLSPEDDWMCNKGLWVKHGNPSAPMPTTPCN
jgi:hypothetical protein